MSARNASMMLLLAFVIAAAGAAAESPRPPGQPATGPGGLEYPHKSVRESTYGEGSAQFWIFEPAEPAPSSAPFVLFLHGWGAMEPKTYRGWIEHLVRRGNVVIFPRYQENLLTSPAEFHLNIILAYRAALSELAKAGHVHPFMAHFAVVGHSAGGVEAINFAAGYRNSGTQSPVALMSVEPGRGNRMTSRTLIPMNNPATIPSTVQLVVVLGDDDQLAGSEVGREIYQRATGVAHRSLVTVRSDDHGWPQLRASHFAPASQGPLATDALDFYAFWRLLDGMMDAGIAKKTFVVDPAMGAWSDGVPVKPLLVETVP